MRGLRRAVGSEMRELDPNTCRPASSWLGHDKTLTGNRTASFPAGWLFVYGSAFGEDGGRIGAEAGTRTPMSIRSLRPECGSGFGQSEAMPAFREVALAARFAGMV